MKINSRLIPLFLLCFSFTNGQNTTSAVATNKTTEWVLASLFHEKQTQLEISGAPKIIASPYGEAVYFDGIGDAFFLKEMPLQSLQEFTVEMIFNPDKNAPFEQRLVHIGEATKDRMLLEIRTVETNWYFDGYAASGTNKKAVNDEKLLHPLRQWYHVAFVVSPDSLTTYVNGKQELQESFSFNPIENGTTAIGVRLNKVSWFKGAIYKIRITPKRLQPDYFMGFKA